MRHRKFRQPRETAQTFHHILFQKKHFQQGYAKQLREHPYMGKYIDDTLHAILHSKIHDVPAPNGRECRLALAELNRCMEAGLIDYENDTLEQRIDFLIEIWQFSCPATVAILRWQRNVAQKFYTRIAS